ncbi:MAG: Lrp/AsnC ligand binding domain-containing protein [Candidatus Bathyarchaeota archaeon]|nr:Lrp/AsnC ligand binding domain-containing protein [Candidatus Bathyarchaeota archaeon]
MPKALVCITTDLDSTEDVLKKLRVCDGVEEAVMVYGIYDIIAKVQGKDVNQIKEVLKKQIMGLGNVQKTLTMMVAEPE